MHTERKKHIELANKLTEVGYILNSMFIVPGIKTKIDDDKKMGSRKMGFIVSHSTKSRPCHTHQNATE